MQQNLFFFFNFRTFLKTIWQIWSSKVKSREELFIFAIILCFSWMSLRRIAIYEQKMASLRSTDLLHASAQKLQFLSRSRYFACCQISQKLKLFGSLIGIIDNSSSKGFSWQTTKTSDFSLLSNSSR